jgi:flagellar hook-associated protein 2
MSTSGINVGSSASAPITFSGLASGLNTSSIIAALMRIEREPVTHLSNSQAKLQAARSELQGVQSSLQSLSLAVSEFTLPSLFESAQSATSNEPSRVSASTSGGAAIGGYEVEVTRLANAAQRTFTYTSPASEQAVTIEGREFQLKAGESAQELATAINSDSKASVYAAALQSGAIVLSSRTTGASGGEFIKVSSPGGALVEQAGSGKEGVDAAYKVDGVEGTSHSNTVTGAIPGVTLTLGGLTPNGPVTIDVQPPGLNASVVESQIQSFVKLYNSTVETLQRQLATKPPANPASSFEYGTGTLFADPEVTGLLDTMRAGMYEPVAGLEAGMTSLADIGISTGAPTGSSSSTPSSLEGLLTIDAGKLSEAIKSNPLGVQKLLQQWSSKLQKTIDGASGAGGSLETRINSDTTQITQLTTQIGNMNEMLALREKALQRTYAELEAVISRNDAQSAYVAKQSELLGTSTGSGTLG